MISTLISYLICIEKMTIFYYSAIEEMTAKGHSMVAKHKFKKNFFTKKARLIFKVLNVWPILILIAILFFGIYVWDLENLDQTNKLSLTVLLGTAAIYCFQFMNMRQASKSQKQILQQQCDIAQKQHDFELFTLRMNLRNELVKYFTVALSSEDISITNDVNMHLVNIGKICNDIKFAFTDSKELQYWLESFQNSCIAITKLAPEKQYLIECKMVAQGVSRVLTYKDCLRVVYENEVTSAIVISKTNFEKLGISEKEKDIIFGILSKYIKLVKTKEELDNYMFVLFHKIMSEGKNRLDKLCEILDKEIKL